MFNFKNFARQAFLSLALVCASAAAMAGPTYLVTIDTQAYPGESGLLDFGFLGDANAANELVTVSNFSGAFGAEYDRAGGVVGALGDVVTFSNTGSANFLTQEVILGGGFSFLLNFSGDYAMPANPNDASGLTFVVALFNSDLSDIFAQLVQFDLMPFVAGEPANITITANANLVDVAEVAQVPEPSQLLLMLSALALAGAALRRRKAGQ